MNAARAWGVLLLASGALLGSSAVRADPRDIAEPPEPMTPELREARRVQMATDMDAWLRKLEGRFRIEGVFYRDGDEANALHAKGMEDCITIGPGAGMQCVINVLWDEDYGADGWGGQTGVSSLAPAMIEYGFDPVASKIRTLQVDNQSLAEPGEGLLKGETARSSTRCANTPASQLCQRVTRIYIPADLSYISMTIDVERNYNRVSTLSLDLRRMTPEEAAAAASDVRLPQLPSEQEQARGRPGAQRSEVPAAGAGAGRSGGGRSRR